MSRHELRNADWEVKNPNKHIIFRRHSMAQPPFYNSLFESRSKLAAQNFAVQYDTFLFWPRGYKTFFILNSAEHEIYPAHNC